VVVVVAVVAATALVVVADVDALVADALANPTELAAERGELDEQAAVTAEATLAQTATINRTFIVRFLLVARSRSGYGPVPTIAAKLGSHSRA
jgi:hypothetical protein